MGLTKILVLTTLALTAASYYNTIAIEAAAADPFCYATCSGTHGNDECLADCIKRRFNRGGACVDVVVRGGIVEKLCCCSP